MRGLLGVAVLLAIVWFVGLVVFKVAGFFIHLLALAAVLMLLGYGMRRLAGDRRRISS